VVASLFANFGSERMKRGHLSPQSENAAKEKDARKGHRSSYLRRRDRLWGFLPER
jgi:hypothetical protein